jgi:hypothetical protein
MNHPETFRRVPAIDPNAAADNSPAPLTSPATRIEIDDRDATAGYANFCRLSGTPEELIIDFGLNPQPTAAAPVAVTQRVVTGWHTAKRLLNALQMTVQRHEATFGVLETDVQKRARRA